MLHKALPIEILKDSLLRVASDPACPIRWQRLTDAYLAVSDTEERKSALAEVEMLVVTSSRSAVFKATFLAEMDGVQHLGAAAEAILADLDVDRAASYIATQQMFALASSGSREAFCERMITAKIPAVAKGLADRLEPRVLQAFGAYSEASVPRRVAIIAQHIGNGTHTPTVMASQNAEVLVSAGLEVAVFSAQELRILDVEFANAAGAAPTITQPTEELVSAMFPVSCPVFVADADLGIETRWNVVTERIAAFNPDVVLFIGLSSPLAAALRVARPVIGLSINSVPPTSEVDLWLSSGQEVDGLCAWPGICAPIVWHHSFRLKRPEINIEVTRQTMGFPPDALLLVTSGYRLDNEISSEWGQQMLAWLDANPTAIWLMIGPKNGLPPAIQKASNGRVFASPPRQDAATIVSLCDIYVNPPRMGGGFSVAEAMAVAVPVVSLAGSDGGDKVGVTAAGDLPAFFNLLSSLASNSTARNEMGGLLADRFRRVFDIEQSGPSLISAFIQARDNGELPNIGG